MIERGSGRTSGLTDWQLMDVASMWACVKDHDTTGHWRQVSGWHKVCDLSRTHLSRLQEYRRGLAAAWPPETNAAARAYVGELDSLIEQVQATHDSAAANLEALSAAARAIDGSRPEIKRLYEEYSTKLEQKRGYEATLADPKAAAGSRVVDPPVTDADLERLNVQARGVMFGLSGELQQAQVMLRTPPPPKPVFEHDVDVYGSGTTPPSIPAIVPVPLATSGSNSSITRPVSPPQAASTPAPPAAGPVIGAASPSHAGRVMGGGVSPGAGPILGGASAGPAPTAITTGPPGPPAPSPSPGTNLGMPPGLPPLSGSSNGRAASTRPVPGQTPLNARPIANGELPRSVTRPLLPGGLIGGTPGMGIGPPGLGAGTPRRVNPVGGVIGGGGAGTAPTGGAGSRPGAGRSGVTHGVSPVGGAPGSGSSTTHSNSAGLPGHGYGSMRPTRRDRDDEDKRHWDPDSPWEVEEGVDPVVRPPEDHGPDDPGPAIGFDR